MGRANLELVKGNRRQSDDLRQICGVLEESAEAIFTTTLCLVSAEALSDDPEVTARIAGAVEALDDTMTTVREIVLRLSALRGEQP